MGVRIVKLDENDRVVGAVKLIEKEQPEENGDGAETPEEPVEADVDARRLDQPLVVGLDREPALGDRGGDVAVGQQHGAESVTRPLRP